MNKRSALHWQAPVLGLLLLFSTGCSASAPAYDARDPRSPARLVRTIALPDVHGRIDHMALDPTSGHLFVAEFGNGSVDDVDLATGAVAGRISGLHEPQGVAWLGPQNEIAVACGDGTVRFYRANDRRQIAEISLGDDADNVRVDSRTGMLLVGYGSGAIALIDPSAHRVVRELKLTAHPEAFSLVGSRLFVNIPDSHTIAVADLDRGRIISAIGTGLQFGNFPMAADPTGKRIAIAYRMPDTLSVLDAGSGAVIFSTRICGDADDLYFRSTEWVVVCGSGSVKLVDDRGRHAAVSVTTQQGARTGLLDATGHLFIAVPSRRGAAAIWELSLR